MTHHSEKDMMLVMIFMFLVLFWRAEITIIYLRGAQRPSESPGHSSLEKWISLTNEDSIDKNNS